MRGTVGRRTRPPAWGPLGRRSSNTGGNCFPPETQHCSLMVSFRGPLPATAPAPGARRPFSRPTSGRGLSCRGHQWGATPKKRPTRLVLLIGWGADGAGSWFLSVPFLILNYNSQQALRLRVAGHIRRSSLVRGRQRSVLIG